MDGTCGDGQGLEAQKNESFGVSGPQGKQQMTPLMSLHNPPLRRSTLQSPFPVSDSMADARGRDKAAFRKSWRQFFQPLEATTQSSDAPTQIALHSAKEVLLRHPGWSVVAQSPITATFAFQIKGFSHFGLPKTGFHHVGQAILKFLTSTDLPTLASQSAEITGVKPPHNLALLLRLECSSMISVHSNLCLQGSSDPSCLSLLKAGFCHVAQAGLELLGSSDAPALASQSAGIIGKSHCLEVMESYSVAQAGVQYGNLGSLQPLPLRVQDRVSPCFPGSSQTLDLVICRPRPPKVLTMPQ
ncbi:hypothetical protein AAY473_019465 [Plecturocebus cupreus]